jgi:glycine/D-amino acid oxidase-like deaminating enzyme
MTSSSQRTQHPADPSWWFAEALALERDCAPSRPLAGRLDVDVAIVGGGYTGLWTALALKERAPATSVALIEAKLCGSGASGKNGGKVAGYWSSLGGMARAVGDDNALAIARMGTVAQDAIRSFATAPGRDLWWREDGSACFSAAEGQDAELADYIATAKRLGVPKTVRALLPSDMKALCNSPVLRAGVFFTEGATIHPARLARALRQAAIDAGVLLFENTAMIALDRGSPNRVRTRAGDIIARDVVLATNAALAKNPEIHPYVSVFSSFALMTEPSPESLEAHNWQKDLGLTDCRMFIHYFRKTPDGRVLMGSGSGPISFGADASRRALYEDDAAAARAERGLRRLLPAFANVPIAKAWGGPIEVSADRLPFFKTFPGTRVHYACGYSGHGVNPSYIGGQCLASLVLGRKDQWSSLALCTREPPRFPPEPFRYLGGNAIRWGIMTCEEADEAGVAAPMVARLCAALPRLLGMKVGTR